MHLAPTPRQRALRAELRGYFRALIPPDVRARLRAEGQGGPEQRALLKRIAADGLLGLGWPQEYGGQGRGADEQFVFFDEAYRAGAPVSMVTLNTVGPTLMKFGTDEQKAFFLPRILAGEIVFAIGYTEPEAGTDLASLRTRAVREGDDWLIDGGKSFTSNAGGADWIWLACRTAPDPPRAPDPPKAPDAPKAPHKPGVPHTGRQGHRGISIILVPTDAPGFSWTPIRTVGGVSTTATYYDSVRVPAGNVVGEVDAGWRLITNQLNHERVALAAIGMQAEDYFDDVLARARTAESGQRPIDQPWARARIAESYARLAATRLLSWRLVGDVGAGTLSPGDASGVKFAGTESTVEVYRALQDVAGERGLVRSGSPGVYGSEDGWGDGELERMNRAAQINTFGGGVSEIQREIVATMRLGMPRAPRRQR